MRRRSHWMLSLVACAAFFVQFASSVLAQSYPDDGCSSDILPDEGRGNDCPDLLTHYDFFTSYFDKIPGSLRPGLGANEPGIYWVFLEWESDRRWGMRTIEDGECDTFCAEKDTPSGSCPSDSRWLEMDGLKLRVDPSKIRYVSGTPARYGFAFEDIQGPYNKSNSGERLDWEWMAEENGSHCRTWTERKTPLMEGLYWVFWNGQTFSSVYQGQWMEPDGLGGDDWSVKENIDVGKALTQCLQRNWKDAAPGEDPSRYAITGPSAGRGSLVSYICQGDDVRCTSPGDYKIEVYYNVYCRIMQATFPGSYTDWMRDREKFRKHVHQDDIERYGRPRIFLDRVFGKGQSL